MNSFLRIKLSYKQSQKFFIVNLKEDFESNLNKIKEKFDIDKDVQIKLYNSVHWIEVDDVLFFEKDELIFIIENPSLINFEHFLPEIFCDPYKVPSLFPHANIKNELENSNLNQNKAEDIFELKASNEIDISIFKDSKFNGGDRVNLEKIVKEWSLGNNFELKFTEGEKVLARGVKKSVFRCNFKNPNIQETNCPFQLVFKTNENCYKLDQISSIMN